MLVVEYIINNIDTIPDIESAAELGKSLGVNVVVVKVTLSMLELGDFLTFKEIIKRSIKENSIIKSDDIKESSEDISIKNEEVDFDKLISNILGQDSISKEEEKFNISNIKNVLESKSINIEVDTSDELAIDSVFKEERFNEFKEFCCYNKIKRITDITYDDIMDFKFEKNISREILSKIARVINQYDYEYSKSDINLELEELREEISCRLCNLKPEQEVIGEYIVKNLDKIHEIGNLRELADSIGVSQFKIPAVLTKLNLGTFTAFKKKLKMILIIK